MLQEEFTETMASIGTDSLESMPNYAENYNEDDIDEFGVNPADSISEKRNIMSASYDNIEVKPTTGSKYFGQEARVDFYRRFKDMQRHRNKYTGNESVIDYVNQSKGVNTKSSSFRSKPMTKSTTILPSLDAQRSIDFSKVSLDENDDVDSLLLQQSSEHFYSSNSPISKRQLQLTRHSNKQNNANSTKITSLSAQKRSSVDNTISGVSMRTSLFCEDFSKNSTDNTMKISEAINQNKRAVSMKSSPPVRLPSLPMHSMSTISKLTTTSSNDSQDITYLNSSSYMSSNSMKGGGGWGGDSQYFDTLDHSPRTKYLGACIRENITPLAKLVLRKDNTTKLNLSHLGMKDNVGSILAEYVENLPNVESIDISGNHLTDGSLPQLILSFSNMTNLIEVNLSRSKIDEEASDALAAYLASEICPLKSLILQSADIDDYECARFITCLKTNQQLRELDLSSNLLGSAEIFHNTGNHFTAGGKAIADFIGSTDCRLHTLKLGWNSLKLSSSIDIAKALSVNETLLYLDLSYNGLSQTAGEYLGDALQQNQTIQTLLLDNNQLNGVACHCICVGILENTSLKRISLDKNPIGEFGAKAVVQIPADIGQRAGLTAKGCNTKLKTNQSYFNFADLLQDYTLHLDRPYERILALWLLRKIASHSNYAISKCTYENQGKSKPIELVLSHYEQSQVYEDCDIKHKQLIEGLRKIKNAASDKQLSLQLFEEADTDHGGTIDREELITITTKLGLHLDSDCIDDIFNQFDIDVAASLEKDEFFTFLAMEAQEAEERIQEVLEYYFYAESSNPSIRYVPPRHGILTISIIDNYSEKGPSNVLNILQCQYMIQLATEVGDVSLVSEVMQHYRVRYNEALILYKVMTAETGNLAWSLSHILPRMKSLNEARLVLTKTVGEDQVKLARVKNALGNAYQPLLGNVNGYYCLNLAIENDRLCLSHLLGHSKSYNMRRCKLYNTYVPHHENRIGDTSQHGNWTFFRNEMFNKEPFNITPANFTPMLRNGLLEFDFSSCMRPSLHEHTISDFRLIRILNNLSLIERFRLYDALSELGQMKNETILLEKQFGSINYEIPLEKARNIALAQDSFYNHLNIRSDDYKSALKKELLTTDLNSIAATTKSFINLREHVDAQKKTTNKYTMGTSTTTTTATATNDTTANDNNSNNLPTTTATTTAKSTTATTKITTSSTKKKQSSSSLFTESTDSYMNTDNKLEDTHQSLYNSRTIDEQDIINQLNATMDDDNSDNTNNKDNDNDKETASSTTTTNSTTNTTTTTNNNNNNDEDDGMSNIDIDSKNPIHKLGIDVDKFKHRRDMSAKERSDSLHDLLVHTSARKDTDSLHIHKDFKSHVLDTKLDEMLQETIIKDRNNPVNIGTITQTSTKDAFADLGAEKVEEVNTSSKHRSTKVISRTSSHTMNSSRKNPSEHTSMSKDSNREISSKRLGTSSKGDNKPVYTTAPSIQDLRRLNPYGAYPSSNNNSRQNSEHAIGDIKRLVSIRQLPGPEFDFYNELENDKEHLPLHIYEMKRRIRELTVTESVNTEVKAGRILEFIVDMFSQVYIRCRHLVLILKYFKFGGTPRTSYFGSYNVELVVILFIRLIDLHNFESVLNQLSAEECAALYCRLGMLNLFNPLKIDNAYEMNLARREERIVAKMIITLSVSEYGHNITNQEFQWERNDDPIPGWTITEGWKTNEGIPPRGLMRLKFNSHTTTTTVTTTAATTTNNANTANMTITASASTVDDLEITNRSIVDTTTTTTTNMTTATTAATTTSTTAILANIGVISTLESTLDSTTSINSINTINATTGVNTAPTTTAHQRNFKIDKELRRILTFSTLIDELEYHPEDEPAKERSEKLLEQVKHRKPLWNFLYPL